MKTTMKSESTTSTSNRIMKSSVQVRLRLLLRFIFYTICVITFLSRGVKAVEGFVNTPTTRTQCARKYTTEGFPDRCHRIRPLHLFEGKWMTSTTKTTIFDDDKTATNQNTNVDDDETTAFTQGLPKTAPDRDFQKGFAIIAFITLLNASLSPVWHFVYDAATPPPPLLLNAVVSVTALTGLVVGGPWLDKGSSTGENVASESDNVAKPWSPLSWRGGIELGFWKGLGTTCHIYGMALTTANHGAFLLQLTTLIVPVLQAFRGEQLSRQLQVALVLALGGIYAFSQDPTKASDVIGDPSMIPIGDALVLGAAFFYSLYDIQTFTWGRQVPRKELVTIKVGFQALLSCLICAGVARQDTMEYLAAGPDWNVVVPTVLWSGLIVNALATFLQVQGMQSVGPTRAQTIFASQPLWAAGMNYVLLGSILGVPGLAGGTAFMAALVLAATATGPTTTNKSEDITTVIKGN